MAFPQQLKGRAGSWACPAQSRILGSLAPYGKYKADKEFLSLILNGAGAALCQPSDTVPAFYSLALLCFQWLLGLHTGHKPRRVPRANFLDFLLSRCQFLCLQPLE